MRAIEALPRGLALVLVTITVARAQVQPPIPNFGPPLVLRLEGVIHSDAAAAKAAGFDVTSIELAGAPAKTVRWIGVTKAQTVSGDHFLDGKDVLAAMRPFRPNLFVPGPPALVGALRDAPDGAAVRLEGLVDRGARTYYLREVQVTPAGS
jgi:hypothetical protein